MTNIEIRLSDKALRYLTDGECGELQEYLQKLSDKVNERAEQHEKEKPLRD